MNCTLASLPRLPFRLSQQQLAVLTYDLPTIVQASNLKASSTAGGWDPQDYPPWNHEDHTFDDCHLGLVAFWRRIRDLADNRPQPRYRLSLNAFEAGVSELALRTAARAQPLSTLFNVPKNPANNALRHRLIQRLENQRRQAQRSLINDVGKTDAKLFALHCAAYYADLREELFGPLLKWYKPFLRSKKQLLDRFTALAMEGLKQAGIPEPPPKDVRKKIRQYLAYSRRGRGYHGIPFLVRHLNQARGYFTALILASWERTKQKLRNKKEIANEWTQISR